MKFSFSIIIPIYNSSSYLEQNLLSIVSKIERNEEYEIILIDDKSKDIELIKKIISKFRNVSLIEKEEKSNAADSRNIGLKKSKYDLVFLIDSDDIFLEGFYKQRYNLHTNTKSGVIFGDFLLNMSGNIFNINLPYYKNKDMRDYLFGLNGDIRSSTISIYKPYYKKTLFDPESKKHQDWIFGMKIFDNNEKIFFDKKPTVQINVLDNQRMSSSYNLEASKYLIKKYINKQVHINNFSKKNWKSLLLNFNKEASDYFISIYYPESLTDNIKIVTFKFLSNKSIIFFSSRIISIIKNLKWYVYSRRKNK